LGVAGCIRLIDGGVIGAVEEESVRIPVAAVLVIPCNHTLRVPRNFGEAAGGRIGHRGVVGPVKGEPIRIPIRVAIRTIDNPFGNAIEGSGIPTEKSDWRINGDNRKGVDDDRIGPGNGIGAGIRARPLGPS